MILNGNSILGENYLIISSKNERLQIIRILFCNGEGLEYKIVLLRIDRTFDVSVYPEYKSTSGIREFKNKAVQKITIHIRTNTKL